MTLLFSLAASANETNKVVAIQQAEIARLKLTQVPVGGIVPIAANLTGSWQPPASGVVKDGFMICDGNAIPAGNTLSGHTPALMDGRFLMGSTQAGSIGGQDTLPEHSHTSTSLTVDTRWAGNVTGEVADKELTINRDLGGIIGQAKQGNAGVSTLNLPAQIQQRNLRHSSQMIFSERSLGPRDRSSLRTFLAQVLHHN